MRTVPFHTHMKEYLSPAMFAALLGVLCSPFGCIVQLTLYVDDMANDEEATKTLLRKVRLMRGLGVGL